VPTLPRKTKTITFSLPPEMAEQVRDVMRNEGRTMSELIRETLRNYMEEREWLRTIRYERLQQREKEREDARRRTRG
jgi:metal-responsive CopG/Arc/MetJ family transcriptional regulator